ncbi:MAG: 30S ribosome-binding factor RbfA [Chlamydiales bacterium]|nr:30S ribosome-binding factor RbfA [Chlamydiia bacterium]MCP5503542.1 30S ribosome-binding factor RbfA [Chlamydiales bacterium]
MTKRTERLNSLLKEVLSEVIRDDVRNPNVAEFTTVTAVDISKDLHHAKVYISVIGTDTQRKETVEALESAAGFIGVLASKKVVMRHFPTLTFRLDTSVDKQMKIDSLLKKIHEEEESRGHHE